jgi:hypothetical protein
MAGTGLSRRELNRALLQRQLLLDRTDMAVYDAVEHLVGMQAQEPQAPYVGLWTRLNSFAPRELSDLIAERRAVRLGLMRATIHLVTAPDCVRLWPLMRVVLARTFKGSAFSKALAGIDLEEVLTVGQDLLAQQPRTRVELGALLAQRWPDADATALGSAVSFLTPLVQVPPRGLWQRSGAARGTTAQAWLETKLDVEPAPGEVVLRYLAAFGPATVNDIQAWCGLTRLRPVTDGLRDRLRTFRAENGNELLDVADAPLPDPQAPAPPRFLPPFDNAILGHADRSRIIAPEHRDLVYRDRLMRVFLIDGFVAGTWRIDDATLYIRPIVTISKLDRGSLVEEGERLLAFVAPDAASPDVRIADD